MPSGILLDSSDYTYDVMDRLIVRSSNGVNQSTVYDGSHVWADFAGDGQVESRYLFRSEVDELAAR